MDPLTALGLASNVIQLISFTNDLISKSRQIYRSANGELVEHLELETIAKSLQDLSSDIPTELRGMKSLTRTEKQLRDICTGCKQVSKELIDVIDGLKATGEHKKWNSFRQALNSVWKEDTINALSKRLERYRSQLDTALLVSLREQVQEDGRVLLEFKGKRRINGEVIKPWHSELIEALHQNNWQSKSQPDMAAFSLKLSAYTKVEREQLVKEHILEQLRFTNMVDRYERIEDAYSRTFNWIFPEGGDVADDPEIEGLADENWEAVMRRDTKLPVAGGESSRAAARESITSDDVKEKADSPRWSSFINWLTGGEGVYWITGKPGSGKSTLMKYLYNEPRTLKHSWTWSGSLPLVTAGFFFWNSGTVMQMSKMGLLQALLYEIINDSFELVPALFPERWKSYERFGGDLRPWTWSELAVAFKRVISDESRKFLVFIDGLDEFDGDCTELANFVLEHSQRSNVKMCVASRPWLVFEDAFQRLPSLRLEDLTARDIHLFVSEKLRGSTMFANLQELQPQEAEHLISEVTGKSSGVFLWVRLVVVSLLEGLRDGDSIKDLQDRLYLLPLDLEELFSKILDRLNPSYLEQASKLFQLVRASKEPLSLLTLSFVEDGFEKAMAAEVEPIPQAQAEYRAETMRRRLNSRCKGLLEANIRGHEPIIEVKVQYLHRTVKDFLGRPDIWEYVASCSPGTFDPDLSLFGAILLEIKTLRISYQIMSQFEPLLNRCITHYKRFESTKPDLNIRTLKELDQAGTKFFGTAHPSGGTWLEELRSRKSSLYNRSPTAHWTSLVAKSNSFFDYAFQIPLYSFIEHGLQMGHNADSLVVGEPLLYAAVESNDFKLIEILLNHGADPNFCGDYVALTPWTLFQLTLITPETTDLGYRIVSMFLEHNADPRANPDNKSVEDAIKLMFYNGDQERTSDLLHKIATSKRKFRDPKKSPLGVKTFLRRLAKHASKTT